MHSTISLFNLSTLNRGSLKFELEAHASGIYDFDFGAKMQGMLQSAGFKIVYFNDDVTDPELNFTGAASNNILDCWLARLKRMRRLRDALGSEYIDFCNDLLSSLRSETHEKRRNVRFVVAKKYSIARRLDLIIE